MASFQDAFREGIEASESAARAKAEIFQVFDACAEEVNVASKGAIALSRERSTRDLEQKRTVSDLVTGVLPSSESYDALVAHSTGAPQRKRAELCEYRISYQGYPVTLLYADVDERCHDKTALVMALESLLKHPVTGGKLRRIMGDATRQSDTEEKQSP
jgi:hypothetical protein